MDVFRRTDRLVGVEVSGTNRDHVAVENHNAKTANPLGLFNQIGEIVRRVGRRDHIVLCIDELEEQLLELLDSSESATRGAVIGRTVDVALASGNRDLGVPRFVRHRLLRESLGEGVPNG